MVRTLTELEAHYSALTAVWSGRLTERSFFEALARARISAPAAASLLVELLAAQAARKIARTGRRWHDSRAARRLRGWQARFFACPPAAHSEARAAGGAGAGEGGEKEEEEEGEDEGARAAEAAAGWADEPPGEGEGVLPGSLGEAE